MSRLMSVAFTAEQVIDHTKTVSRRTGWRMVKADDTLWLCRKVMGRKLGEPLVRLAFVRVIGVRREPLSRLTDDPEYGAAEMVLEGFPGMDPAEFIERYFVRAQKVTPATEVARIEWVYVL